MTEIVTLNEFRQMAGKVWAPTALCSERSDYVKVVKSDLLRTLSLYGYKRVELAVIDDEVFFYGALED